MGAGLFQVYLTNYISLPLIMPSSSAYNFFFQGWLHCVLLFFYSFFSDVCHLLSSSRLLYLRPLFTEIIHVNRVDPCSKTHSGRLGNEILIKSKLNLLRQQQRFVVSFRSNFPLSFNHSTPPSQPFPACSEGSLLVSSFPLFAV